MNWLNNELIIYMHKNTDKTPYNISHLAPLAYIWELPNPSRFLLSAAEQIECWELWSKTFWQQFLSEMRALLHVQACIQDSNTCAKCTAQITGWFPKLSYWVTYWLYLCMTDDTFTVVNKMPWILTNAHQKLPDDSKCLIWPTITNPKVSCIQRYETWHYGWQCQVTVVQT